MVLSAASLGLRRVLWESFDADPVVRSIVGAEAAIVFSNPTEALRDSANRLSLFPYLVAENEFAKNQPPVRAAAGPGEPDPHRTRRQPPMALDLFYMATPIGPSGEADLIVLGKTMETLYDNSTIVLRDRASGIFEELRVIFCRLELQELAHVWEALNEPYRLSVCYQLKIARIDSRRLPQGARVVERTTAFREPDRAVAG